MKPETLERPFLDLLVSPYRQFQIHHLHPRRASPLYVVILQRSSPSQIPWQSSRMYYKATNKYLLYSFSKEENLKDE